VNRVADGRRGGYLALVDTGILPLRVAYSQDPILRVHLVHRLETLIARVRVTTNRQQVNVAMPHPRDLRQKNVRLNRRDQAGINGHCLRIAKESKGGKSCIPERTSRGSIDRLYVYVRLGEKFPSFRAFAIRGHRGGPALAACSQNYAGDSRLLQQVGKSMPVLANLEAEISSSREPRHRYR